jgi:UDP-N-acetylmuramoyl-tripeptide--D-alanyl-D-alanine ligase
MLKNILQLKAPTLATKGNLNNHLGVPMTLLRLTEKHQYAVIEMGANHLLNIVQVPSGNFAERILRVFHHQSGQT